MPRLFVFIALLLGLTQSVILLLVPAILEETGIAFSSIGGAVAVGAIVRIVCAPLCGRMADRLGTSRVLGIALTLIGISYTFLVLMFTLTGDDKAHLLYLNRMIVAAGSAGALPIMQAFLTARYEGKELSNKVAFLNNGFYLGILVGPLMLAGLLSFSILYPLALLMAWSVGALIWLLFSQIEQKQPSDQGSEQAKGSLRAIFPICLTEGLFCSVVGGLQIVLGVYIQYRLDMPATQATYHLSGLLSLTSASMIAAQFCFAKVHALQGQRLIYLAVLSALFGVLILQNADHVLWFYGAVILVGIGISTLHPWSVWSISGRVGANNKGWALGVLSASATAGNALGAALLPIIFEWREAWAIYPMIFVFLFILAGLLVATLRSIRTVFPVK